LAGAIGENQDLLSADFDGALGKRVLRRRWTTALICVLALLLGSLLCTVEEAEARGKGEGSGPAHKPAVE
jgi:uncharacterized membrane protein YdfJ with MMPL/SSD domain